MKRKIKKFAGDEGSVVRTRSDDEIAADNKAGYGRYMPKTKEYTFDEVKDKLFGLFGGKKEDTSKYDELESVGGAGRRARTIAEQIGSKSESKADVEEPHRKISDYITNKGTTTVSEEDAPSKVEKTTLPRSSGSGGNRPSSSTKTSSDASKAAESKYKPNEERKSKPYPKDAKPLKPVSKAEEDAEGERGKRMEEEAAAQLKKNKSTAFKQKDDNSTDKIIDKTVKDTSGVKTVYSNEPFSFTKNLQDKKDKEKKSSSADDRYKTYKETNAKYQKMLDDYKNKKDDDSKVSGPGGARAAEKNTRDFKGPFKDDETYKRMKDANKANLRAVETDNQRTFKERAEAAKAEADKAEKKAARAAKKEGAKEDKPAPKKESKSFAANKAKSSSTAGKMPGPKMDPYSMTLGSDLDPKRMMRDRKSSGENDMKKGGRVKGSSASSRADGIAMRGKTRGRIY